jgi:hypothetical protein
MIPTLPWRFGLALGGGLGKMQGGAGDNTLVGPNKNLLWSIARATWSPQSFMCELPLDCDWHDSEILVP